jgi:cysteine desulfurase/selenocysteine lyase
MWGCGGRAMQMLNISAIRADTPGVTKVIHFNNAGAALMPRPVVDAVKNHLDLECAVGAYEAANSAVEKLNGVYRSAAQMINASEQEIAVVENATRAWDMAFYSFRFSAGDRIITSASEYSSNFIALLHVAKNSGAIIEIAPANAAGEVDVDALASMIDDRVKLIALTHIPTNGGLINPAAAVGKIAASAGIPYILDACQSVGQIEIDVADLGCDVLCATGRKFLRGPRGTGFLYVRQSWIERLDPPFLDNYSAVWTGVREYTVRKDAKRFETWECNTAGKIGLGVAIDYALRIGMKGIQKRVFDLSEYLRQQLERVPGITVRDLGVVRGGIVSFSHTTKTADHIAASLSACSVNTHVSRDTSTRIDMEARGLSAVVRASVHYYNDHDEVDRFISHLQKAVS